MPVRESELQAHAREPTGRDLRLLAKTANRARAGSEKIFVPLGVASDAYLEKARVRSRDASAFIRHETRYMSVLILRP